MTTYLMPAGFGEAELVEKRSRFIGRVWPVETEAQALEHIEQMRKQHHDARHNCFAYCVRDGGLMRYSDDSEPQGTAGQPILNVFRGREITNFCCVVTRYFGGILLGTGGLVRAYSEAAKLALEQGCNPYPDGGFRIVVNTGSEGGQEVHHLHLHVMGGPRPWLKG